MLQMLQIGVGYDRKNACYETAATSSIFRGVAAVALWIGLAMSAYMVYVTLVSL